jgi:BASS family bile acid:Na+ symporter
MVAVGLDVTRADLRAVAGRGGTIASATIAQALVLPALAWAIAPLLSLDRVAGYLLLVAASPGGGMSNVYVYLARANTALSVTLTAVSCLAAVVTMPALFAAYAAMSGDRMAYAVPIPALLGQLLVMAVIPVTLGAWLRDRYPALERTYGRRFRALSAAGVLFIVAVGVIESARMLTRDHVAGGLAATLLAAGAMAAGWLFGAALRMSTGDRFTLLVEFAVRNLAIAMVIEVTLLGHPDFVTFGALALSGQVVLLLPLSYRFARRRTAE